MSSPEWMMRVHDLKFILSIFFFFFFFTLHHIFLAAEFEEALHFVHLAPPLVTYSGICRIICIFLGQRCLMFANDVLLLFVLSASVLLFMACAIRNKKDSSYKLLY